MDNNEKWLKIASSFDEEFKLCDYTPEELAKIKQKNQSTSKKFKDDYFSFYDDVKSSSLKKQDW